MSGLKSKDSFVDKIKPRKNAGKWVYGTIIFAVLVVIMLGAVIFFTVSTGGSSRIDVQNFNFTQNSENMLGKGGTTPYICYGNGTFVVLWYGTDASGNWVLNATEMDLQGNIIKTVTVTNDLAMYYSKPSGKGPRIVYDPDDNIFLVVWYSGNKSLDGMFLSPNLDFLSSPTVLNSTYDVDYHAFGVTYIGNSSFMIVWNDASYDNFYRIVQYNNGTFNMGPVGYISSDRHHSHLNDMVAYDPTTGNIMIIWRNSTGLSGAYNITGKIYSNDMSTVIKNDFTIADGYTSNMSFDMPNIAAGDGKFMVIYANRTYPYTVYGTIINATNGEIMNSFMIGYSYYGIKYYGMGIAYNGSGGFMVAWPDSHKEIMATLYSDNGTKIGEKAITSTSDAEESPVVAASYGFTRATSVVYQFVWYDYTAKELYTANYSESVFVPEFSAFLPLAMVLLAAVIVWRKRN